MKTLAELFEIIAKAVANNNKSKHSPDWFIDYSGHVNKLYIRYYQVGWSENAVPEGVSFTLNDEGIQGAYWFIKTRLTDEA